MSKKEKGTFVIHITKRENASWQGQVVWADKDVTMNFRSTLELVKMIDQAITENMPEADELDVEGIHDCSEIG